MYQPENSVQEPSVMDLLKQHFNLMNPYGAKLAKLKEKISALMNDPTVSDQQKVIQHIEMMNESRMLKEKYRDSEGGQILDKFYKCNQINQPSVLLN